MSAHNVRMTATAKTESVKLDARYTSIHLIKVLVHRHRTPELSGHQWPSHLTCAEHRFLATPSIQHAVADSFREMGCRVLYETLSVLYRPRSVHRMFYAGTPDMIV